MKKPDPSRQEQILTLLRYLGEPFIERELGLDNCIDASLIAQNVLNRFAMRTTVVTTRLMAVNNAWLAYYEQHGRPPVLANLAPDDPIWSVGVGYGYAPGSRRSERYDGHVVATYNHRWLIDLSLGQVSRPDKDMPASALVARIDNAVDFFREREKAIFSGPQTHVIYELGPQEELDAALRLRSHQASYRCHRLALELERLIRRELRCSNERNL